MWFEPLTSWLIALLTSGGKLLSEKTTKSIPAENWANKELYNQDLAKGVPVKQRLRNAENGKYRQVVTHPEPHRHPKTGKIVIENCKLYNEDLATYGAVQVHKWMKEGRYNLSPEALKKEEERIKAHYQHLYNI